MTRAASSFSRRRAGRFAEGKIACNWRRRGKNFAEATIQAKPLQTPQAFDEPTLQALEQLALQQAPPDSQSVEVVRREQNPIIMNQSPSFEVLIAYKTLGYTFQRSVIFVHTPDTELIFQFTAPKEHFDVLNATFRRSIGSWRWVEAKPAQNSPAPFAPAQPPAGELK